MWLADLFYGLRNIFVYIAYRFGSAAYFFESHGWPAALYNPFYDISSFFSDVALKCRDIGDEIEDLWDWINDKFSDLSTLWNYAYGWLTDKATSAYNTASSALTKANQAINDAATAFQQAISEAAAALAKAKAYALSIIPDIAAWVSQHAVDIYNSIKGYIVDIAAWVSQHAVDIYNAIKGYIIDIGAWLTGHISDIWDALKGFAADLIAAQLALFAELYNWWELNKVLIKSFFDSPWDWLEAKFIDWFLGPEQ